MSTRKNEAIVRPLKSSVTRKLPAPEHLDLRLWLKLMTVHKSVKDELGRRFYQQFSMTLPRFDLMSHLRRKPEGVRMVELSRRLMVTNGNITGITDRLEAEGVVLRTVDPENRSAILITLTPKGIQLFDVAAEAHDKWLSEIFGALINKDKVVLLELLGKQKDSLKKLQIDPKA